MPRFDCIKKASIIFIQLPVCIKPMAQSGQLTYGETRKQSVYCPYTYELRISARTRVASVQSTMLAKYMLSPLSSPISCSAFIAFRGEKSAAGLCLLRTDIASVSMRDIHVVIMV